MVERIQVNEDSVWSGAAMDRTNPDAKANYKKVRSLLLEGRIQEAEQFAEWSMYATNPHMRHYQTLGDIWIRFYKHQGKKIVKKTQGELLSLEYEDLPFTDYQRELDLEQAVGNVRYKVGEASYKREYFVSYPDQVMVYRMQAENGASLDLDVFLTRKDNRPGRGASYCDGVEVLEDGTIRLYGMQGGRDGIAFELAVQVEAQGGTKRRMGSHIIVANAKEAMLYVTARTSFRTMEPLAWCLEALKKARRYTYQELKQRHIQDYQSCYLQSILKLEHDPALSALSTPERLERMRSGAQDVGLVNTYFNFAKYLLIAGTIFETPVYIEFLGIPVLLMNYASSVIPVIVTSFFAAKMEKFFAQHISDLFKTFAVPALTMLTSIILGFLLIGPVATFASNLLGAAFTGLFDMSAILSGFLYGALIQVCVMFGIHWGFVAISVNNLATIGYDPITIAGLASAFGQAGVVLMIMLKTRNKKLKSVCGPALLSAMVGITEPSIYGVTLQFKKPFILACLASGIGGAIIGFGGVKQYFYGTNGIFGWLQVINPQTGFDSSVVAAIVACAVSFVAAVVLMAVFGKDSIPEK